MYAHSRLLLRQGFPGAVTELDTAAVSVITRSRSAAQHQRPARLALGSSDRESDREAAPEDQEGLEASGVGGCRRGRGLSIQEALQLAGRIGHQCGQGCAGQYLACAA